MQVSTRSPTDQRITDAVRITPYPTHVIRQHGQLALMPQESTSRSRKPRSEKRSKQERQQRALEEPHFNVGAPRTPRRIQPGSPGTRTRPNRRPDVTDAGSIPDYPPPSFDEAVAAAAAAARNAPPLSPTESTTTSHSSFSDSYQPAPILIPPLPRSQNQPVVVRSLPDHELRESLRYSTQADYDSDEDLEVISTSEATSSVGTWEQDRHRRVFPQRAHVEVGISPTSARTLRPSPSQLTLTPQLSESSQDTGDDIFASSPSTDSQGDDHTVGPHNSTPSPVPPRRRLHLLSGLLLKSRDHPASAPSTPTHAAASQLSLPIHLLTRPGSPSKPHRGEGLISRKLFGHKGKDRVAEPQIGGPPEPLDTWDMLSDVERETPPTPGSSYPMPPISSASEHFPGTPRQSDPAIQLLSLGLRREGTRPKHLSMLNHPLLPPTLPLTPTTTQRQNMHMDLRAAAALGSTQRQPTTFAVSATASASAAVPSPSSPSRRSTQAPLNSPSTVVDSPTRGRSLRATASMIWNPKRHPPVPSPTRSTTTHISPSSASLHSGVTNVDYDTGAPATLVGHEDQEAIHGTLTPSLVQEEEEENFVTPPGSPVRSPSTLPTAIGTRHPSPVRHEGRIGVTLRDEGPVSPVSPARSEAHTRAPRTPTITPRPSINALYAFAPPNPSPLSNQSFERQALIPPAPPSPTLENSDPPRRDTVCSVADTESLIDLYVHSTGPTSTSPVTSSTAPTAVTDSELDQCTSASSGDPKQYHYPGRPLPHPPGASQSGPVQPVLLDTFLAGNIPGGLPPYEEVELERQGLWRMLPFSQTKPVSNAPCLPPSPFVNQPSPRTPPRHPPPELFPVFDEDASEPSSPGSTYEMPPSTPSSVQRGFAGGPDEEDEDEATATHHREDVFLAKGAKISARTVPTPSRNTAAMTTTTTSATGTTTGAAAMTTASGAGAQYSVNGAQLGRVEVVRRRVTRSGRVKLKLVLRGATVDRCVMCATQFRDRESAALGPRCQHAFHERCAGSWLDRGNRTCPTCGAPFD